METPQDPQAPKAHTPEEMMAHGTHATEMFDMGMTDDRVIESLIRRGLDPAKAQAVVDLVKRKKHGTGGQYAVQQEAEKQKRYGLYIAIPLIIVVVILRVWLRMRGN